MWTCVVTTFKWNSKVKAKIFCKKWKFELAYNHKTRTHFLLRLFKIEQQTHWGRYQLAHLHAPHLHTAIHNPVDLETNLICIRAFKLHSSFWEWNKFFYWIWISRVVLKNGRPLTPPGEVRAKRARSFFWKRNTKKQSPPFGTSWRWASVANWPPPAAAGQSSAKPRPPSDGQRVFNPLPWVGRLLRSPHP